MIDLFIIGGAFLFSVSFAAFTFVVLRALDNLKEDE